MMPIEVTRRLLLESVAVGALLTGLPVPAEAFLVGRGGSGSSGGGGPSPLTTETIVNTSASPTSGGVFLMTQAFRYGDVPSGFHPVLADSSGNPTIPHQLDEISYHPDGSVRHVRVALQPPAIAGNGTYQFHWLKQAGSYTPGANSRSTADITAHDFKLRLTDVRNPRTGAQYGSGNFTFSANAVINNTIPSPPYPQEVLVTADGAVGKSWRVSGCVTDDATGNPDTQMWGRFYFNVWSDPSNPTAVYAVSYIGIIMQPWMNVANPDVLCFKFALYDGATLIRDLSGGPSVALGTAINTTTGAINVPNHGFMRSENVLVTVSGTFPTGLSASQAYFVGPASSAGAVDPNNVYLYTHCRGPANTSFQSSLVKPSDQGSGTLTFARYAFCPHWGGVACVDDAGEMTWTANQSSLRCQWTQLEQYYRTQTGVIPPYDTTITTNSFASSLSPWPTSIDSMVYRPGVGIGVRNGINGVGDAFIDGIPHPAWVSPHFINQDAQGLAYVRAAALGALHIPPMIMLNENTGYIPAANNGANRAGQAYPTLGVPAPETYYAAGPGNQVGVIPPLGGATGWDLGVFYQFQDGTHWSPLAQYAYVVEGERHLLDLAYFDASCRMVSWSGSTAFESRREIIIGTNHYYCKLFCGSEQRQVRGIKSTVAAILIGADSSPEKPYFEDVMAERSACALDYYSNYKAPSYSSPVGAGSTTINNALTDLWMHDYNVQVAVWDWIARRDANTMSLLNILKIFATGVWDGSVGYSSFWACPESHSWLDTDNEPIAGAGGGVATGGWANVGVLNAYGYNDSQGTVYYGQGAQVSTLTDLTENGDTIKPYNFQIQYIPSELSNASWYYCVGVNTTSKIFQLSATNGGSPITPMSIPINPTAAILNSSTLGTGASLSADKLTVTAASPASDTGCKSIISLPSNGTPDSKVSVLKSFYFEMTFSAANAGARTGGGVCSSSATYPNLASNGAFGAIVFASTGNIFVNGTNTGISLGAFGAVATTIGVAIQGGQIWFKNFTAGGSWNGTAGASPGGTGGISLSANGLTGNVDAVAVLTSGTTDGVTFNFGATAFSWGTLPAAWWPWGFAGWSWSTRPVYAPPLSAGTLNGYSTNPIGYQAEAWATLHWMAAMGLSGVATALSQCEGRWQGSFQSTNKYNLVATPIP